MCITWTCEILSFFFTSSVASPIVFFDIINALQGVFIFMLFVLLPKPWSIIKEYFKQKYTEKVMLESAEDTIFLQNGN